MPGPGNHSDIEKRLWDAADELRANSKLKASEYSLPVLGLIFLKYADHVFGKAAKDLEGKSTGRRTIGKLDYQSKGVLFLPEKARFSHLIGLPEGVDIGRAIDEAMRTIEEENEELKGVLPKNAYSRIDNSTLFALLKNFNLPLDISEDKRGFMPNDLFLIGRCEEMTNKKIEEAKSPV